VHTLHQARVQRKGDEVQPGEELWLSGPNASKPDDFSKEEAFLQRCSNHQ
jgi:hypothetical protein